MKIFRVLLCLAGFSCLGLTAGFAQMSADEALSKFVAGGMAYKEGRYDEAVSLYNEILRGGRVSGPLYYNLGNSYFKKGNLGRAVLSYERAGRFIPRDGDLNFNRRYARSRIVNYGGEKTNLPGRLVRNFILFYTIDEMVIIMACAGIAVGIVYLISLYLYWPRPLTRWAIAFLTLVFVTYGAGLIAKVRYERDTAVAVAAAESYFEPRADSTVHFKLPEGAKVKILKTEEGWAKVRRPDGKTGWVPQDALDRI